VALSKAALEVLAIEAYRQPVARSGIELTRPRRQRQRH
jgi:chromosome segregation and condensation protein ScpB